MSTGTSEEQRARLLKNLEAARAKRKELKEADREKALAQPTLDSPRTLKRRPRNLDKIIRDILDDETFVDAVVSNQPGWWSKLPYKTAGYIMSSVIAVKAMGGDIKAAEWIAKRGFGDKVVLETDNGFFSKDNFTIQVIPSKQIDSGEVISAKEVLEEGIKQIEHEPQAPSTTDVGDDVSGETPGES